VKKFLSIWLIAIFLLTHLGVHVDSHYCMDRLTHSEWFSASHQTDEAHCACGMEKERAAGCCQDVSIHVAQTYQAQSLSLLSVAKPFAKPVILPICYKLRFEPKAPNATNELVLHKVNPPPQWYGTWQVTKLLI
jgi:hypothetical protein